MPMFGSGSGSGFQKPEINWGGGSNGGMRPPDQPNWGGGNIGQIRPMPSPGPFPMPRPMPFPGFQPPRYSPGLNPGFNEGIGVRPPMPGGGYRPLPTFPMPRPIQPGYGNLLQPIRQFQAYQGALNGLDNINTQMYRTWS